MIYFQKLFKIPGPADIGMSHTNNAMASSLFPNDSGRATWEDYFARIKQIMPVRYFFCYTVINTILSIWYPIRRFVLNKISYVRCHVDPSRRFHMLDLRQPKTEFDKDPYRYGWRDTDTRMEYALFNLLVQFVEKELPVAKYGGFITEEFAQNNPDIKDQYDQQKEFMAIYNYWKFEKPKIDHEYEEALTQWSNGNKQLSTKLDEMEKQSAEKLNEMLHRLIDVRHSLWT